MDIKPTSNKISSTPQKSKESAKNIKQSENIGIKTNKAPDIQTSEQKTTSEQKDTVKYGKRRRDTEYGGYCRCYTGRSK